MLLAQASPTASPALKVTAAQEANLILGALGWIAAAVLAGAHQDFHDAQKKMTSVQAKSYRPIAANRKVYTQLYTLYRTTHDAFGGVNKSSDLSRVMKDLLALKSAAHA